MIPRRMLAIVNTLNAAAKLEGKNSRGQAIYKYRNNYINNKGAAETADSAAKRYLVPFSIFH